ncbi:hypothetical protein ABH922_002811 [Rhodococcus sp. 27YEA15]|uniref:hypothetical protein n=1 Tax=Rhodococcus sp. 27YEA15 TaxID=3156259 RepID=UPI003C7A138F
MDMQDWAGPAWDELDDEQRARLNREADRVGEIYPDPDDQYERDAALSAAVQYMLGETSVAKVGDELRRAKIAVRQLAVMAVEDGQAETRTARDAGVDRMTIRKWLGK